jgi:RNA polymerase sigma factor (sigma-70 family)
MVVNTNHHQSFTWNFVARNFRPHEQLQDRLREKIAKLERHLQRFPPDAVHLLIGLEKHPRRQLFTAALTLRVPSNVLRSEKQAADPVPALDHAVKALLREIADFKSALRREPVWKRKERRAALRAAKIQRFSPLPMADGAGPQNKTDVIRALIEQSHSRLLRYVRRHIWHEVALGKVRPGAIDARDVVDEVACRVLADPDEKPADLGFLLWFYRLARQELARRCQALQVQARETVSLEEPRALPKDAEAAAGYEPEQSLDIVEHILEPPVVQGRELISDSRAIPPDEALAQSELLEQMQKTANSWPTPERDLFELHFVEGFEPEEIGMVLGLSTRQANELLDNIRGRLREALLAEAAAQQP